MMNEPEVEHTFVMGNEFAEIKISHVRSRNGSRLLIHNMKSGAEISICPLALESLTWQTSELFTALLSTPYGPEVH